MFYGCLMPQSGFRALVEWTNGMISLIDGTISRTPEPAQKK
jgi:hypothetical protein